MISQQAYLSPDELKAKLPLNWDARAEASIQREKAEAEDRYGIRISRTEIYCAFCGHPAGFFHTCSKMPEERRAEIEEIKASNELPVRVMSLQEWREDIGTSLGMTKEQAFEKFFEWQALRKTCQRCEGEKLVANCTIRLVCKEANNVRDAKGNGDRRRVDENTKPKVVRAGVSEARKRASVRQAVR